jgi:hypothetical protein
MIGRAKQLFSALSTVIIDATTLQHKIIRKEQFTIGYGTVNTWNLDTEKPPATLLTFNRTNHGLEVDPTNSGHTFLVSGKPSKGECLSHEVVHTLQVQNDFFLINITKKPKDWLSGIKLDSWRVFEPTTGKVYGPFDRLQLETWVVEEGKDPSTLTYVPHGLYTGFSVDQLLGMELPAPVAQKEIIKQKVEESQPSNNSEENSTQARCPHCWSPLFSNQLLSIATHESLRGDPLLGPDEMLRFKPDSFNSQDLALDETGTPCLEHACPHCRLKVSPGMTDLPQAFISILGSPGAGKSYYLSVLTDEIQKKALENWGLNWEDADPTDNAPLNSMRHRLSSAQFAADAYLAKTSLDGHLYSKVNLNGRPTQLPRPFTYILEGPDRQHQSLTFYDNAGEQFQPDSNGISNPVTHHLAHAHLWCFLFDPSKDVTFRKHINGSKDPQLSRRNPTENQELLLSELKNRMRVLHQLPPLGKLNTPLAFIIGKMDIIKDWEPITRLTDPWNGHHFNSLVVERNSNILREGLMERVPGLVARAESLSEKVVYFASTTFGHSPRRIKTGELSPIPKKIKPKGVEVPVFWWLTSWSAVFANNRKR